MPILWSVLINTFVILATFSSSRLCIYIHAFGTFLVTATTLLFTIMLSQGLSYEMNQPFSMTLHYYMGNICLMLSLLQVFFGLFTRVTNVLQLSSQVIRYLRRVHKITGIILSILCKFQVYYNPENQFIMPYFALQLPFIAAYLWLQFKKSLTQSPQQFLSTSNKQLPQITSLKQIKNTKDLGLINNKVFDLEVLKNWHPPGFQVVSSIRSKQLDKYLLGIYAPQKLSSVNTHQHSTQILNLLNQPIAELAIPSNYSSLTTYREVKVEQLFLISSEPKIYEMHLSSPQGPFQFINYRDIGELGRYHSLTLNRGITRFYTNVNFLQDYNMQFLKRYFKVSTQVQNYYNSRSTKNTIPLLFKHYPNGAFTNAIINQPIRTLEISQQMGFGLSLSEAPSGQIIIIAGGTGIFPFADLIDLLFKLKLVRNNHVDKQSIKQRNPIIRTGQLQRFIFKLWLGFRSVQQIHPLLLQLLIQIADVIQVKVRFDITTTLQSNRLKNINIINHFYDNELRQMINKASLSLIIVCGPPLMRQSLLGVIEKEELDIGKYLIL